MMGRARLPGCARPDCPKRTVTRSDEAVKAHGSVGGRGGVERISAIRMGASHGR